MFVGKLYSLLREIVFSDIYEYCEKNDFISVFCKNE